MISDSPKFPGTDMSMKTQSVSLFILDLGCIVKDRDEKDVRHH